MHVFIALLPAAGQRNTSSFTSKTQDTISVGNLTPTVHSGRVCPQSRSFGGTRHAAFPIAPLSLDADISFLQGTDVKTGNVYCIACEDFVYDGAFSAIQSSISIAVEERMTNFHGWISLGLHGTSYIDYHCWPVTQRGKEPFSPWEANKQEATALAQAAPFPCQGQFTS